MNPSGLLGQLNQSMASGQPEINQVSATSPSFQPGLQPPAPTPLPDKSPASMMGHGETALHRALQRRGMPLSPQLLQLMQYGGINSGQAPLGQPMPPPQADRGEQQISLPIADDNPQKPGTQIPLSEAELIIKALTSRMKTISDHESKVRDHLLHNAQNEKYP